MTHRRCIQIFVATFIATITMCCSGCGRKGPLLPPEVLVPAPVRDLTAQQKGDRLQISWTPPKKEVGGASLRETPGANLLRRDVSQPGQECPACTPQFTTLTVIPPNAPAGSRNPSGRIYFDDADVSPGKVYDYYITSVLSDGSISPPSNHVQKAVVAPPVPPVLHLAVAPVGFELSWTAASQADKGLDILGYNVYRRKGDEQFPSQPVNMAPVKEMRYEDLKLEANTEYHYAVRTIARVEGGEVESSLSNEVSETFKP